MVFTLAGCGSKEDESGSEGSGEPTGKVVVYSPHDADPLNAGVELFKKAYPGIDVEVVAAGTGELAQRVVAEAANPQCDVFWGGEKQTCRVPAEYTKWEMGIHYIYLFRLTREGVDRVDVIKVGIKNWEEIGSADTNWYNW